MLDLIIRNASIYDGNGGEPFMGDIGVADGLIREVGTITAPAHKIIDAKGQAVTPGFVDIHTHYDGQATWSNRLSPSCAHGVTTAIMGNCGVGFAPCKPQDRHKLVELMEGIEDIPEIVMTAGVPWKWETFEEYLDFLDTRNYDIDIAAQLPHAPLRVYVMGEKAMRLEEATEAEIAEMKAIAQRAMEAGAIGFTTSRSVNHRSVNGDPTPSRDAAQKELLGIAAGVGQAGTGVLQGIADLSSPDATIEHVGLFRRMAETSGRPLSFTLMEINNSGAWKTALSLLEQANDDGVKMRAQVFTRPVGIIMGLELSRTPLSFSALYQELQNLPLAERVQRMRRAEVRATILAECANDTSSNRKYELIYPMASVPNYEPEPGSNLQSLAAKAGVSGDEIAYDLLLENDGHGILWGAFANFYEATLDNVHTMMTDKNTVIGLGDGGAHYGLICDASYPTHLLAHWARDRRRGEKLAVAFIVKALTRDNAETVGLLDRGIIAPGYKADFNIIDLARIQLQAPSVIRDLPSDGRRMTQLATGYVATIVNGEVTYENGVATGALPGKLVRASKVSAPINAAYAQAS